MTDGKHYLYEVIETDKGTGVKVGQVILYRRAYGPMKTELLMNTKTFQPSMFKMKYLGPCEVKNGKITKGAEHLPKPPKNRAVAK